MEISALKAKFIEIYGGSEKDLRVFSAAGRVNLIGEHIDYNGGPVFPAALNLRCCIVARKNSLDCINLAATTLDDRVSLKVDNLYNYRNLPWGTYQAGVAYVLKRAGYEIVPCDLLYDADVPFGSGLSSSAAIEVATAFCLATFSNEKQNKKSGVDLVEIARLSQTAENEYAGVNCGIMDQFASSLGKKDNAIYLNCKDLSFRYVPMQLKGYKLVIANTNKIRALTDSKYNERRAECEEALAILKTVLPGISCLADVSVEMYERHKGLLPDIIAKRCKHVVYECDRVVRSEEALIKGDMKEFGRLLTASHTSLKELYEVTGKELDAFSENAVKLEGCIGARMTGAGFGGCAIALVKEENVESFVEELSKIYTGITGLKASFYKTTIEDGAHEIV